MDDSPTAVMFDEPRPAPLPPRPPDGHKGTFGRVACIGGSTGMAGSIALTAQAALRSGSGLVGVQTPADVAALVAGFDAAVMVRPCGDDLFAVETAVDAVAVGPGLSRTAGLRDPVRQLLRDLPQPTIADADALFFLRTSEGRLSEHPRVLTPHPGEFARLTGQPLPMSSDERRSQAEAAARELGVVLVLKGQGTVVTDGERTAIDAAGTNALATGGSGDVLTGVVVSLLGQGLAAWDAARWAVRVHALAGQTAADRLGARSVTAGDLIAALPAAWQAADAV